jgi:hypothetical protein
MCSTALAIREVAATGYDESRDPDNDRARAAIAADPDALEELADEIVVLSAHIHAATHRLLVLIAEFDRLRGWEPAGHRTCAHWLAARTGLDLGAAREKVRAARALARLPQTAAAMARGELSFSQVRALTRVAQPDTERDLLAMARGSTTAQLERMIRAWRRCGRKDEAERERERYESRGFSVFPDDDGMYVVRGRLPPELGALLMRAIEAAGDALFGVERAAAGGATAESERAGDGATAATTVATIDNERAASRRRADAVALLAERALAAGFDRAQCGARAERYQVVLHVDADTLAQADSGTAADRRPRPEPVRSELEDGTRVSPETSRRLSCDASVVRVTRDRRGDILDIGRRTRTIPPALRRALAIRDRGCRFPGCGSRFTDAHHVRHWADGGETSLSNCLLLCAHHHRLVHEGGWRVEWWGKSPVFRDPRGHEHYDGGWRPPPPGEQPVQALIDANRRLGIVPDPMTLGARWRGEADIPLDVYCRASEAM